MNATTLQIQDTFPSLLAQAMKKHQIDARAIAHKSKVSTNEIEEFLKGTRMPEPRTFARMLFTLPSMQHLKPAIREAYQRRSRVVPATEELDFDASWLPAPAMAPAPSEAPLPTTFRERLRALRLRDELTEEDVAEMVEVTNQSVSTWETGVRTPIQQHYDALVALWPELADVPAPSMQQIDKPGPKPGTVSTSVALPPPSPSAPPPTRSATVPVELSPRPTLAATPRPVSPPPPVDVNQRPVEVGDEIWAGDKDGWKAIRSMKYDAATGLWIADIGGSFRSVKVLRSRAAPASLPQPPASNAPPLAPPVRLAPPPPVLVPPPTPTEPFPSLEPPMPTPAAAPAERRGPDPKRMAAWLTALGAVTPAVRQELRSVYRLIELAQEDGMSPDDLLVMLKGTLGDPADGR
jgi:DNA-binding XRE family transcriptional regulator